MKKQYIKMNDNDKYLSLGNLFRLIKEISKNKSSALQGEIFCVLFEIESINDTTVNNYCVGCRGIGNEYKQIYINKEKRYRKNKNEFINNIIGIINIMDGVVHKELSEKYINSNESVICLANKLYNLAKNDDKVTQEFTNKLHMLLVDNNIYECLVEEILHIVLIHKQPIYEDELKKEVLENVLNDTSISSKDLQEYLSLKLREGINYDYSMKKLAHKGNAYANFELGSNEYYGYVTGSPRYNLAYEYLCKAAEFNHAGANYMLGSMYIKKLIGSGSNEELQKGYEFILKSYELGNIAACNFIGNMYFNGIYPLNKDVEMAKQYFLEASSNDYAFAYNNLGRIAENEGNLKEAFRLYLISADLGESWACNKVGEYYRLGVVEKNMDKAFYYYNKAIDNNYRIVCFYAFYNLAMYYYMNGYDTINKDEFKAIQYLEIASEHNILEARLELFKYYTKKYLRTRDEINYHKIMNYKKSIEIHDKYNEDVCKTVEKMIKELKSKREININI